MTTGTRMTAEDLLQMPDDGYRYELVRGELVQMAPAGRLHGRLAMRIGWRLAQYVESHQLGEVHAAETGFRLASSPDTVRAPHVSFLSRNRIGDMGDVQGYWPGAPDLAVEVISPSDTYTGVESKVLDWLDGGAAMVLVVNPRQQTVTVYRSLTDINILTKDDRLDGTDVVPGWSLKISDLFA